MSGHRPWVTLRELDERLRLPKGTAFRAFKRAGLAEGSDFRVLGAGADATEIARLRAAARIYPSSVNVVLLSARAAERLAAALRT